MLHESIAEKLGALIERSSDSYGTLVLELQPARLVEVVGRLKSEFGFDQFLDVTAVDYPQRDARFDVVYQFRGSAHRQRVRLKLKVTEAAPRVPTLTGFFGSARFMEREAHDMYGIEFDGNADLRPILLYEGFVGHPLRKDYPMEREQPIVPYRN